MLVVEGVLSYSDIWERVSLKRVLDLYEVLERKNSIEKLLTKKAEKHANR